MPDYDPVNYPKPAAPDLTPVEIGRDTPAPDLAAWPSADWMAPDPYAGPVPSREFETSGLGRSFTQRALAPDPDPTPSQVQPSIAPPPGA